VVYQLPDRWIGKPPEYGHAGEELIVNGERSQVDFRFYASESSLRVRIVLPYLGTLLVLEGISEGA